MSRGFTLIELVVVIGLMALFMAFTLPVGMETLRQHAFLNARESIRTTLTTAREDTLAGTNNAAWGVALFPHDIVRFQGSSYASRVPAYDVTISLGSLVTLSGPSEVTFTRPDGFPSTPSTLILTDSQRTATTTVNVLGTIDMVTGLR